MDRPILFSDALVRAILDGRKTVTRRPVKPQPPSWVHPTLVNRSTTQDLFQWSEPEGATDANGVPRPLRRWPADHYMRSPFSFPVRRLWVKECFATLAPGSYEEAKPDSNGNQVLRYRSSDRLADAPADVRGHRWRPSIHMPRWASRITLEVESVRVERLQAITEEAARAEGVEPCALEHAHEPHCCAFGRSWDRIYPGDLAWAANPWVWVLGFKVAEVRR